MKTKREQEVAEARAVLGDKRLLVFLRRCRTARNILACKLINTELDRGESLDEIFYTGEGLGYYLAVKRTGTDAFDVSFGCQAGPLEGDGGEWSVSFTPGGKVARIKLAGQRIS